jgi:multiple sugar transport system permease protein
MSSVTLRIPNSDYAIRSITKKTLFYLALIAGAIFISIPTLWMVSASLMTSRELFSPQVRLFPSALIFTNYAEVFSRFNFGRYLLNSVFVTGTIIVLNLLFCPLVGYSLAKFQFPGRNLLFMFVLSTIMVPFTAILVPLYIIVRSLGWINSYQAMIVPFAMSATGIFLMRQFIFALPDDYTDAARIDGASEFTIYWRIVLPICQPALVTLAILTFIGTWDEFLWVLIVTTTEQMRTLPIGLAKFVEAYQTRWELMMAGATVAALPAVLAFVSMQRRFLTGMASLSGIK